MNRSLNQAAGKACVTPRHAFWLLGLVFLSIGTPAPAQTVPRLFAFSLPLFSLLCAWNQKDGPLESPAVTTNFYIQTYTTGSILVVVSADGVNGYAFLDDDFSNGVDAFDLGGAGHHLNVGFTSQTEETGALTLSGSSPATYDLRRWFPASMVEDYQGIFRHGASVGPGTASYYVQTYETALIMIRSTDARTFLVFIDTDKTDGMDAGALGGGVHLSCGFTGADEAEGTISFDGGIPRELTLSRAFKSPYPPLR